MADIELIRAPALLELSWLRHGFSTRAGGRSSVYGGASLNLGWTAEDDPACVRQNRAAFVKEVWGSDSGSDTEVRLVTVRQIHSDIVRAIGPEALDGSLQTADGKAVLEGDGLVTDTPGILIAAGTADCAPVLIADNAHRSVGAFHAGWRGTVAGIVQKGVALMKQQYGSRPEDLVAVVGPSIGPCCYTVGEEVREQFAATYPYGRELFQEAAAKDGKPGLFVDLWQANHRQLLEAGLLPERVSVVGECTACKLFDSGERRYFSHRADKGHAGRMLNAIGIV
jgi:YfiH family protein